MGIWDNFLSVGSVVNPVGLIANALTLGAGIYGTMEQSANVKRTNQTNRDIAAAATDASAYQAALNRAFTHDEAAAQMLFQEKMSSTAFQRAAQDMKAAGINPMLAATASESSPSGAMGSGAGFSAEAIPSQVVPSVAAGIASTAKDVVGLYGSFINSVASADAAEARANKDRIDAGLAVKNAPRKEVESKLWHWLDLLTDTIGNYAVKQHNEFTGWQDQMDGRNKAKWYELPK